MTRSSVKIPLILSMLMMLAAMKAGAQASDRQMQRLIKENLAFARDQYKLLAANTPAGVMPRNVNQQTGELVTSNTSWWTSGFFPGTLWYIYEFTGDTAIRAEAERRLSILEKEKYHSSDHDLGFMIYCSFGNAYRITKKEEYRDVVYTAAETLSKRYRRSIRSIQSWDSSANFKCPVIIDNMMNLELLCWVSDQQREPKYKVIAIDHTLTTMKNHYRPDYSSFHVVDYDLKTGKPARKVTAQGAADSSAWSRGQAWGLYGFNIMYRFTSDSTYLNQARKIAAFILNHKNLPKDKVPYWDFDAKDIPNALRDVSSASILASALLELSQYTEGSEKELYLSTAERILISLSGKKYRNRKGENKGFILKHSVGAIPYNSEVDVPLTYADYYFVESLIRYQAILNQR